MLALKMHKRYYIGMDTRKFFFIVFMAFFAISGSFAQFEFSKREWNEQTLVPADSFVYDDLSDIASECGMVTLANSAPLPVGEIRQAMSGIDPEKLSPASRIRYERIEEYLASEYYSAGSGVLNVGVKARAAFEVTGRNNNSIARDWDYMHKYNAQAPIVEVPVFISVSDYVTIESDLRVSENYWSINESSNWTNIPIGGEISGLDFLWPKTAYMSAGVPINGKYAFNFQLGRGSMEIGTPMLDSVVLSDDMEAQAYATLSFFSPAIVYNASVIQLETKKYFYLHRVAFRPFRWMSFSVMEGTLANAELDLKFLNPLMIMHSFNGEGDPAYGEQMKFVSQYMAFTVDVTPVKNLRLYGLYAQNEFQMPHELESAEGRSYPNGMAAQLGAVYNLPVSYGIWRFGAEGQYVSPWCYMRLTPGNTFISSREDHMTAKPLIYSWIGSQYGADSVCGTLRADFENFDGRWSAGLGYTFLAHGENDLRKLLTYKDGNGYYFYPASGGYGTANSPYASQEDAIAKARDMGISGTPEFTHSITAEGSFSFNRVITVGGSFTYLLMINKGHELGAFDQGIDFTATARFNIL